MTCPNCLAFEQAERAAIEERDAPSNSIDECACVEEPQWRITYFTPERFANKRQIGIGTRQPRGSFYTWLTTPMIADNKRAGGAWCPCALSGGIVKGGSGDVFCLVGDVDDVKKGDLDRNAQILAPYAGALVPSFNATIQEPKHRAMLEVSRPIKAAEFPIAWPMFSGVMADAGIVLDQSCKNINRLYFAPVARSAAAWLGPRILVGKPIDVDAMLEAARFDLEVAALAKARIPKPHPVTEKHRDKYVAGAIASARNRVGAASVGDRHGMLLREAIGLARFGLSESQIARELLENFVHAAGEPRRREGERAIRDAVAAHKDKAS